MTDIVLSSTEHALIKEDMDERNEMLSDEETERLASKLNAKINIPFIREGTEQKIFVKTVKRFDRMLYKALPNELYGLVQDASDGISSAEADQLKDILAQRLNQKFNLPYLPEKLEAKLFKLLLGLIIKAMRKGQSL